MSNREFKFEVDPTESSESREIRWDKELLQLAAEGLTIEGVGPDGDYPIRYSFGDGTMTFDEWWKGNPDAPWFEVYNLVPLYDEDEIALMDAHVAYEEAQSA